MGANSASAADRADADLKAGAGKTLPTLQDHLKMSQDTAGKVGAPGAKAKAAAKKSGTTS